MTRDATSGLNGRVDEALPLAFNSNVKQRVQNFILLKMTAHFRLFCVLAVAMVTIFHVCHLTNVQIVQQVENATAEHQTFPDQAESTSEQCHFCSMVALPAFLTSTKRDLRSSNLPQPVADISSFNAELTAPPPKA